MVGAADALTPPIASWMHGQRLSRAGLPQVLEPRGDLESLQVAAVHSRVLEEIPRVSAVAPSLLLQAGDRLQKRFSFRRINPVSHTGRESALSDCPLFGRLMSRAAARRPLRAGALFYLPAGRISYDVVAADGSVAVRWLCFQCTRPRLLLPPRRMTGGSDLGSRSAAANSMANGFPSSRRHRVRSEAQAPDTPGLSDDGLARRGGGGRSRRMAAVGRGGGLRRFASRPSNPHRHTPVP